MLPTVALALTTSLGYLHTQEMYPASLGYATYCSSSAGYIFGLSTFIRNVAYIITLPTVALALATSLGYVQEPYNYMATLWSYLQYCCSYGYTFGLPILALALATSLGYLQ